MDSLGIDKSLVIERKLAWDNLFARLSTYTDSTDVPLTEIDQVYGKSTDENPQPHFTSRKYGFRKSFPRRKMQGKSIKVPLELTDLDKDISDIEELSDDSSIYSLSDEFDSDDYASESVDSVQYVLHCNEQRKLPDFNARVENCQSYLLQSADFNQKMKENGLQNYVNNIVSENTDNSEAGILENIVLRTSAHCTFLKNDMVNKTLHLNTPNRQVKSISNTNTSKNSSSTCKKLPYSEIESVKSISDNNAINSFRNGIDTEINELETPVLFTQKPKLENIKQLSSKTKTLHKSKLKTTHNVTLPEKPTLPNEQSENRKIYSRAATKMRQILSNSSSENSSSEKRTTLKNSKLQENEKHRRTTEIKINLRDNISSKEININDGSEKLVIKNVCSEEKQIAKTIALNKPLSCSFVQFSSEISSSDECTLFKSNVCDAKFKNSVSVNKVNKKIHRYSNKENSEKSPVITDLTSPINKVNSNCEISNVTKNTSVLVNEKSKKNNNKENRSPGENCSRTNKNKERRKMKAPKKICMKTFSTEIDSSDSEFNLVLNSKSNVSSTETTKKTNIIKDVDRCVKREDNKKGETVGLFPDGDSTIKNEKTVNDVSGSAKKNSNKLRLVNTNNKNDLTNTSDENTIINEAPCNKLISSRKQKLKLRENIDKSPTVSVIVNSTNPTKTNKTLKCRQRLFTSFSENDEQDVESSITILASVNDEPKDKLLNVDKENSEDSNKANGTHLLEEKTGVIDNKKKSKKRKLEGSNCGPVKQIKKKHKIINDTSHILIQKSITSEDIFTQELTNNEIDKNSKNEVQVTSNKSSTKYMLEHKPINDGINENNEEQNSLLQENSKQHDVTINTVNDDSIKQETETSTRQSLLEQGTDKRKQRKSRKEPRFREFTSEDHTTGMNNILWSTSTVHNRIPLSLEYFLNDDVF